MIEYPQKSFRNFIFLWSGELISAMALVTLLAFMPALLLSPIAGVLADRYDRRLLMILGDGLSAALFFAGLFMAMFGLCIVIAGALLSSTTVFLYTIKSVKRLENGGGVCTTES